MWWDEEQVLWLITPEEFFALPDGVELTCINGIKHRKGIDPIDTDIRFGCMAYGVSDPIVLLPITTDEDRKKFLINRSRVLTK
jgi:hypothetical protein